MVPQFFKDVSHSGLNGKFMSRTISLKLDQDASNESIDDSQSHNATNNTSITSAGSFSKFFGASNNSAKSLHDYMLNDSSLDNIIPEKKEDEDDDDIQITDVREIVQYEPPKELMKKEEQEFDADNTSNDVMLEALYKSQKYTSYLKKTVETLNSKVTHQNVEISNYEKNSIKFKELLNKFKENLLILEKKTLDLKNSRKTDNEKILQLKNEYKLIFNLLDNYKNDIVVLKKQIDQLKKIKISTNYEIESSMGIIPIFLNKIIYTNL